MGAYKSILKVKIVFLIIMILLALFEKLHVINIFSETINVSFMFCSSFGYFLYSTLKLYLFYKKNKMAYYLTISGSIIVIVLSIISIFPILMLSLLAPIEFGIYLLGLLFIMVGYNVRILLMFKNQSEFFK